MPCASLESLRGWLLMKESTKAFGAIAVLLFGLFFAFDFFQASSFVVDLVYGQYGDPYVYSHHHGSIWAIHILELPAAITLVAAGLVGIWTIKKKRIISN